MREKHEFMKETIAGLTEEVTEEPEETAEKEIKYNKVFLQFSTILLKF